jgi:hypothetical protein
MWPRAGTPFAEGWLDSCWRVSLVGKGQPGCLEKELAGTLLYGRSSRGRKEESRCEEGSPEEGGEESRSEEVRKEGLQEVVVVRRRLPEAFVV